MIPLPAFLAGAAMLAGPALADGASGIPGLECLASPYTASGTEGERHLSSLISDIRDALDRFPSLLAALDQSKMPICLERRTTDARGYLDVDRNLVAVSSRLSRDQQWIILVHELRHLEQFSRGFCPSNDLSMGENARAVFAMEADAQAITTLVAWTVRDAGDGGPWRALAAWPEYGDIAQRLDAVMRGSGETSRAVAAAFGQWYASDDRVTHYYYASCSDYLDRQEDSKKLPSYNVLEEGFYESLCRLPDGTRYDCTPPDKK